MVHTMLSPCPCRTPPPKLFFFPLAKLSTPSQHKLPSLNRACRCFIHAQAAIDKNITSVNETGLFTEENPNEISSSEETYIPNEPFGPPTIRDICNNMIPQQFLQRAEQLGFVYPTDVQAQALPALLSGRDCILHSQTGSGKTLCYLFAILSKIDLTRSAVQAIVVVPTRELGMQVVREARKLGKQSDLQERDKPEAVHLNVMALLDGGSLNRQKSWLKADPPVLVVGTLQCIYKMIETKNLKTHAVRTLVIDEVDAMFGLTQHAVLLRTLLTTFTLSQKRQTIFASATIPQHVQFIRKCASEKWVKEDVMHVQANQINKMPPYILHRHVICDRDQKLEMLSAVLCADKPKAAIIFVNEQSEAAKKKGLLSSTEAVADFLSSNPTLCEPLVLREDSNINARASTLADFPEEKNLLIATDLAGRGLDIPEITHVYNFDLPPTATAYVHRGGRTARKPLDFSQGIVTTFVTKQEVFVLQRYQNEIVFQSSQIQIDG